MTVEGAVAQLSQALNCLHVFSQAITSSKLLEQQSQQQGSGPDNV